MHTMSFLDGIFNKQSNSNSYHQQPIDFSNAVQVKDSDAFLQASNPIVQSSFQQQPVQNLQQNQSVQPTPIPQPEQNIQNTKPNSFNRQAVAKWILDEKKMQNIDAMVGMAAGIVPIIASIFWGMAGLFLGGILSAYFIYRFISSKKDVTYIKQTYGLQ